VLDDFGDYLSTKFERTWNLQGLDAGIAKFEAAVEATTEDHRDRAERLYNLGNHLSMRYQRTGILPEQWGQYQRAALTEEQH